MNKSSSLISSLSLLICLVLFPNSSHASSPKPPLLSWIDSSITADWEYESAEEEAWKKEFLFVQQMLGAEFEALSFQQAQDMDLMGGVMIKKIFSGPLSQQSFMEEGFVITKVNDQEVYTIRRLYDILKKNPQRIRFEGKYNDLLMEYDDFSGNYTYLLILNKKW